MTDERNDNEVFENDGNDDSNGASQPREDHEERQHHEPQKSAEPHDAEPRETAEPHDAEPPVTESGEPDDLEDDLEDVPETDLAPSTEPDGEDSGDSEANDAEVDRQLRRLSRRGFLSMAVAAGAGYAGWRWLESRPRIDRRPWPYRRVLQGNERLARAYFDRNRLSPTFAPEEIEPLYANGRIGLDPGQSVDDWSVTLHGVAGTTGPVEVALSEIMRYPGDEMITELRCIEGWTRINRWTGTRMLELMKRYPPATRDGSPPDLLRRPERLVRYVSIETPGRGYYVGLDMASAIHPQTLLVWAMNGEPLDWRHGAPLRLGIPVKYGIKNIKRIATIRYTDRRPEDYWAKRGYDWYAGF